MAWTSHGATNAELVRNLSKNGLIRSVRVREAMSKVDRGNYVPPHYRTQAYVDRPQPLGFSATISAPHMHADALENLLPLLKPGARVLDVGCGSGYMMACFHHLVTASPNTETVPQTSGFVLGIEHIPQLADACSENLRRDGLGRFLESGSLKVSNEDGRKPNPDHGGKWDVIHVGAAAPSMPEELLNQLASPGRMFIPVSTPRQFIRLTKQKMAMLPRRDFTKLVTYR